MTSHVSQAPFALDPLIAEAERRARQRRGLVILGVVVLAAVVAGVAFALGFSGGSGGGRGGAGLNSASSSAPTGSVQPGAVVAGKRIGPVRAGEPKAQVKKTLGFGTSLRLAGLALRPVDHGLHVWFYPKVGIYVSYPASRSFFPRARMVMTRSPQYKTSAGIGVGSSLRQLHRALPVRCGEFGRGKWIACSYGPELNRRAQTEFLLDRSTRHVTQITLYARTAVRPYTP
jgi:hypothetical protein